MVLMTTPTRRFLRKHFGLVFKPAARYPADPRAVFILALSIFGGLTALALNAAPGTLNSILPHWAIMIWGLTLTLGSAATLGGMVRQSLTGIIVEQVGSVMVGVACIYYSALAVLVAGLDAVQTVGIVAAWGGACLIRWVQLQALISEAQRKALLNEFDRAVSQKIQDESRG